MARGGKLASALPRQAPSAAGARNRHRASQRPRRAALRKIDGGGAVNGNRGAVSHQAHGQARAVADIGAYWIWIAGADRLAELSHHAADLRTLSCFSQAAIRFQLLKSGPPSFK